MIGERDRRIPALIVCERLCGEIEAGSEGGETTGDGEGDGPPTVAAGTVLCRRRCKVRACGRTRKRQERQVCLVDPMNWGQI